jgi:hypothetical protein
MMEAFLSLVDASGLEVWSTWYFLDKAQEVVAANTGTCQKKQLHASGFKSES